MSVYFLQEQSGDRLVKIGTTTGNPYGRMASLQTGNGRKLGLLVAVPGGRDEEDQLHKKFATERQEGEWFTPSKRLLNFVDGLLWAFREDQPKPCADINVDPIDLAKAAAFDEHVGFLMHAASRFIAIGAAMPPWLPAALTNASGRIRKDIMPGLKAVNPALWTGDGEDMAKALTTAVERNRVLREAAKVTT